MAVISWRAAKLLSERTECGRDAISRAYYSGYQSMTCLLHFSCQVVPSVVDGVRRESWSHRDTPSLIVNNLKGLIRNDRRRGELATNLQRLYKLRIMADYVSAETAEDGVAALACRDAGQLQKVVQIVTGYTGTQK